VKFTLNKNLAGQKQIGMLGDGPSQCVLDRNHSHRNIAGLKMIEHLNRSRARQQRTTRHHATRSLVAE